MEKLLMDNEFTSYFQQYPVHFYHFDKTRDAAAFKAAPL